MSEEGDSDSPGEVAGSRSESYVSSEEDDSLVGSESEEHGTRADGKLSLSGNTRQSLDSLATVLHVGVCTYVYIGPSYDRHRTS